MFRAGHRLDVFGIVPLKAANKSDAKLCGEKRVFAVGFLTATPARVADNIDVGRVEVETDMLTRVALVFGNIIVVLGAAFGGDYISFLVDQRNRSEERRVGEERRS